MVEVDTTAFTSEQARFIIIHIKIPLDKPIRRRGLVSSREGDKIRIGFKYEHLVGLCFHCRFFGHEAEECSKPRDLSQEELSYSEWLKASHWRKEESTTRKGFEPRQSPRPEASPKKPSNERELFQTTQSAKHLNNCAFNAKFSNDANNWTTGPQLLIEAKSLRSGLSGAKILSLSPSQIENIIKE